MVSYDEFGVIGSIFEPVPVLRELGNGFDVKMWYQWLQDNMTIPICSSVIYVALLFIGKQWMSEKSPYRLKGQLIGWNAFLALFSFFGSLSLVPNLLHLVYKKGFYFSVCLANTTNNPHIGVWGFLFVLSKILEFMDTGFLVLRKKPVTFLHWYHHTTVLIYSWYVLGSLSTASGLWFSAVNFAVHSVMYSYYFLRAASIRVPSQVALIITVFQILQMFLGLFINIIVFYQRIVLENPCNANRFSIYMGLVVYGSYAILFMNFFIKRYLLKGKGKEE